MLERWKEILTFLIEHRAYQKALFNHNDCWFSLHVSQLPKKTLWLLLNALVMIMKRCMTCFTCPKFMRWSVTSEWSFRIAGYVDELHDWSLASITVEWLNFGDGFDFPNAETKMERFATIEQFSFLGYWLCDLLSSKPSRLVLNLLDGRGGQTVDRFDLSGQPCFQLLDRHGFFDYWNTLEELLRSCFWACNFKDHMMWIAQSSLQELIIYLYF